MFTSTKFNKAFFSTLRAKMAWITIEQVEIHGMLSKDVKFQKPSGYQRH